MEHNDVYKTIKVPAAGKLFKDKNSKFYGYAFPVTTTAQITSHLEALKKEHHSAARHWCYAYQLGTESITYRANDDGEPNNSAGMPIYGQIQSYDLTNILVVVVRYFGGVKLGVGGLINAYRSGAKLALTSATIIEKTIDNHFQLKFDYKHMSKVMRLLKENNAEIVSQKLEMDCLLDISVRKSNARQLFNVFNEFHGVNIKEL